MSSDETLKAILEEGKNEFLAHGFLEASLRNIARRAGVTTGAFYGYFKSKAELFDALAAHHYEAVMNMYRASHEAFRNLTHKEQEDNLGEISGQCLSQMSEYIYDNLDAFRLILCCSEGTKYSGMIHEMSELEVKATDEFMRIMRASGREVQEIDPMLEHMLISGMLSAFFETVIHDMPREKAKEYVQSLQTFYLAGWKELMHISSIREKE